MYEEIWENILEGILAIKSWKFDRKYTSPISVSVVG